MKTTRSLFGAAFFLSVGSLFAQSVDYILVAHRVNYVQTGATISDVALASNPYSFSATFEGSGMTASAPVSSVTITGPVGSIGGMTFNSSENRWVYQDNTLATLDLSNLSHPYTTGNYTFTPSGGSAPYNAPVDVTVSSYTGSLMQAPLVTLSGGTWIGANYTLLPGAALTATFNAVFSGTPATEQPFRYDVRLSGPGYSSPEHSAFVNWDPENGSAAAIATTPATFSVGAGQLGAGTYSLITGFEQIGVMAPGLFGSAMGVSLLSFQSQISIVVASPVPEPATYAVLLGLGAVGFVAWRRRQAKA